MGFLRLSSAGIADGKRTGMYSQRVLKSPCKPVSVASETSVVYQTCGNEKNRCGYYH